MMKKSKSLSAAVAIVSVSTMLTAFAPSAIAASGDSASSDSSTSVGSSAIVASSRSFTAVHPKSDLLKESTSTTNDGDWATQGLNVPQTKSQAEKDAEAARKAAEAAAAQAAQDAAASRSTEREPLSTSSTSSQSFAIAPPNGASAASVVSFAGQFVHKAPYAWGGATPSGWDCSGFVQYVFASIGISLPHSSGAQATAGTAVPSLAQAMPGDIIANGMHAGIYVGNGMVVNALNPSAGTDYTSVAIAFVGSYSIRRVL